jgi:hypothetical protein
VAGHAGEELTGALQHRVLVRRPVGLDGLSQKLPRDQQDQVPLGFISDPGDQGLTLIGLRGGRGATAWRAWASR